MQAAAIKVLIVEDEPLILRNISKHIEEADSDFKVIDTAINGQEALGKVYSLKPDVIFTDIRMPVMDGITLIQNIRISFPDLPVVILSGYSDFEYMQQSIDLSVSSYLLKPLDPKKVQEVLNKLKGKILTKRNQVKKEILTSKINRDGIHADLPYAAEEENFMLFLVQIGNLTNSLLSVQNSECFRNIWKVVAWEYLIRDVISGTCEWWVVDENLTNRKFLLVAGVKNPRIRAVAQQLQRELVKYAGEFAVNVAYSSRKVVYQDIEGCANSLRLLMEQETILCTGESFCREDAVGNEGVWMKEKELHAILQKRDMQVLKEYLLELEKTWIKEKIPQRKVEKLLQRLVETLEKDGLFLSGNDATYVMRRIEEREALAIDRCSFYEEIWGLVLEGGFKADNAAGQTEEIVRNIKKYIEHHYTEDINFTEMAEEFHFTAAYLSKIFKKYVHETPLKFMTNLRIEKAKVMLRQHPELSVQAVSEIAGYEEPHYFCRIFKNNVGMTPTEYRDEE